MYATTKHFLEDLGLASLDQLPMLDSPHQASQAFESLVPPEEELLAPQVPEANPDEPELQMEIPINAPETDATPSLDGT